ncbi:Bro-N domain-containing protein [Gallibacterium anatis]|uniref:Antirepressor n=1 Tax=Gallibacterium anatis TaxID=750 RepID=A0A0A2XP65_9PAST|nr:Bro-N domain-containing protein [Gallibacterium anatis]KGQ34126.1 antirepressor [Gallibacterium anatis]
MTNQISTFNFKSSPVRTQLVNNEPHFCLADVCAILDIKNPRDTAKKVLDPKGVDTIYILTNGGEQAVLFINEPNLYRIIFKSRKAEAIEFQNWVFEEVLPTIRKTGEYKVKTTVGDRTGLRDAVNMLVSKKGLLYSDAYQLIHQRFNVNHIDELAKEQLPQAVEYIHKIVLEGELIEPKKHQTVNIPFNVADALMKFHYLAINNAKKTERALRIIHETMGYERYVRNDLAAGNFDIHNEFIHWVDEFEKAVIKAKEI